MYVELEDLQEGRSYAIGYGGRDKEHTFDGSVFDRFVENADTRRHVWPAFYRADSSPNALLFDPAKILGIRAE